jgi:hypothetical protein
MRFSRVRTLSALAEMPGRFQGFQLVLSPLVVRCLKGR